MTAVEHRVSDLEKLIKSLIIVSQDSEIRFQKFQKEMKEFKDEMAIVSKNSEISFQKFQQEMKDFKDEMKDFKDEMKDFKDESNSQWGKLANKLGSVVEDIVAPNIPEIAKKYFNCQEIDRYLVQPYIRSTKDPNKRREFDVVVSCDEYVFLTSSKATVSVQMIDEFIEFLNSGEFVDYFPEYREKILIPIMSSLRITDTLVTYMTRKNIIALVMSGSTMIPINIDDVVNSYQK